MKKINSSAGKSVGLLYFGLLIVPILFISLFGYLNARQTLTALELERKDGSARFAAVLVYECLNDIRNLGVSLAIRPLLIEEIKKGNWDAAIQVMKNIPGTFPFVDRIFLADPDAVIRADLSHLGNAVGTDRRETDWYKGVSQKWEPYICEVFKRRSEPRINVIDVAIPVKDDAALPVTSSGTHQSGRVLGILVLQITLDTFAQISQGFHFEKDDTTFIVDHKGRIAWHPLYPPQGDIVDFSSLPVVQELHNGREGVKLLENPVAHRRELAAYRKIKEFGWGVVVSEPASIAFAERDRILHRLTVVYFVFFLSAILFALLILHLLSAQKKISDEMSDLYNNAPCGYSTIGADGSYLQINDTALKWLGYRRAEVIGKLSLADTTTPKGMQIFHQEFPSFLERGYVQDLEFEVTRKDGSIFPILVNAAAVKDKDGRYLMLRATWFDITEIRKAQEASRAADQKFKGVVDNINIGMAVISPNMEILSLNRQMQAWFPSADPASKPLCYRAFNAPPRDGICSYCPTALTLRDGQSHEAVTETPVDGKIVNYLVRSTPLKDANGDVVAAIETVEDITERKQAEDLIRASEVKYRRLYEGMMDAFSVVDMEGRLLEFNEVFARMFGYSTDELKAMTYRDLTPDEWHSIDEQMVREQVLVRGYSDVYQKEYRRKNGEVFPVELRVYLSRDVEGRAIGMWAIIHDITSRKMKEEQLKLAAAQWQRTFDSITDYVFILNVDGTTNRVNRAVVETLKVPTDRLVGLKCSEIMSQLGSYCPEGLFPGFLRDQKPRVEEAEGADGRVFLITISPVFDETGILSGAVYIAKDITEIKNTARELKKTYEQLLATQARLVQSDKMASLGVLAAGVAHEINNPTAFVLGNLVALQGYVKNLQEFMVSCEKVCVSPDVHNQLIEIKDQLHIDTINGDIVKLTAETIDGVERIKDIVKNLKAYAHPDDSVQTLGDIHQCIEGALSITWNEIKYKAKVEKEFGALPQIMFNTQTMAQVFVNLFVNAAQAIDQYGIIKIKTFVEGPDVYIEIEDSGSGIPAESLSRIFDPFFTSKPVGQGTGLGLAIVQRVIKDHQGEIDVISTLGKGTTFIIRLPMVKTGV